MDMETIPPDEDRTIEEIVAPLASVRQALAHGYQHAVSAMSGFRLGRPPAADHRKVPDV